MSDDYFIHYGDEVGRSVEKMVSAALDDYKNLTMEQLQKAVDDTGKRVLKTTKAAAGRVLGKYKSPKKYISELRSSKVPAALRRYSVVVHNKSRPGLTHLLQHGHGGRAPAAPKEHFPSDARVEEILMENIEKAMK